MSGEKSVLSGEAGQKVTKNLLALCGYTISEHIQYECDEKEKHKSKDAKSGRGKHNVDGFLSYYNPLNHTERKIVLISAKHHIDKYLNYKKTKLYSTTKDLAQDITCSMGSSKVNNELVAVENDNKSRKYEGLITFLSSSQEEKHESIFSKSKNEISVPSDDFNAIYFVDNKRATFLYSAITEARNFSDNGKVSFIYPDTGLNESPEEIARAGKTLPMELICSDVLPILVEKGEHNYVLIFCNDKIDQKYLKRIIWLVHRLCSFASKTVIYFPDYDASLHDTMVNSIKQCFQESDAISDIGVRKYDSLSFIRLKEEGIEVHSKSVSIPFPNNQTVQALSKVKINEEYDKILPYGRMLQPILASSNLSASDLKKFLKRKGIFVKYADKGLLIPFFVSMILSPVELDILKGMLIEKEEKPKSQNKSALFIGDTEKLKQAIKSITPSDIRLKLNCEHEKVPRFEKKDDARYELSIELKRVNSTKELISGTTHRSGLLVVSIENGKVNVKTEYTSSETKDYLDKLCERLNYQLKQHDCIKQELRGIKFSDFASNDKRVEFLTSFKDIGYTTNFFNGSITNIKFKPDETIKDLPTSLSQYKDRVKNLNINGNLLEQLPLILEPDNKRCIYLTRVSILYNFDIEGNQGKCFATIYFPSVLNGKKLDPTRELEVIVEVVRDRKSNIVWGLDRLQKRLARELHRIVVNKYYSQYSPEGILG